MRWTVNVLRELSMMVRIVGIIDYWAQAKMEGKQC